MGDEARLLSLGEVAAIREAERAATPPPWTVGRHQGDPAAFLAEAAGKSDRQEVWCVLSGVTAAGGDVVDDAPMPAVTGNGPTSEANAWFIADARNALPALLGHIAALEVVVTAARAVRASANRLGRCIDEFGNDAPEACSEWFDAHWVALGRLEAVLIVLDLSDQPAPSSMGAEMAPASDRGWAGHSENGSE